MDDESLRCRVCGLLQDDPPWGPDGDNPSFFICDCCGAEFGYEDHMPSSARAHRERWLAAGAPWHWPTSRPPDWRLDEQLAHVPAAFR